MLARALSHAAKIQAQGHQSGIVERGGSAKDDLVVHRATKQWMRVEYQSRSPNWTPRGL